MQEDDLRLALRRREPSEGFAERTLERIRAEGAREGECAVSPQPSRMRRWIAAGLALAASVVVTAGVVREQAARRDVEARAAAQNLEMALQITGETLQHVQMKLSHIGEER